MIFLEFQEHFSYFSMNNFFPWTFKKIHEQNLLNMYLFFVRTIFVTHEHFSNSMNTFHFFMNKFLKLITFFSILINIFFETLEHFLNSLNIVHDFYEKKFLDHFFPRHPLKKNVEIFLKTCEHFFFQFHEHFFETIEHFSMLLWTIFDAVNYIFWIGWTFFKLFWISFLNSMNIFPCFF